MYISKLKLANWRNFKEVDVDLKHRVFIIGANARSKAAGNAIFRWNTAVNRIYVGLARWEANHIIGRT